MQWNLSKADNIGTTAACLRLEGIRSLEASGILFFAGVAICSRSINEATCSELLLAVWYVATLLYTRS